ncbi:PREDICTED: protein TIFY 11A-like [Camelina sativa]|uniref:Protein TIFY n=1 Tax=Camelina sativa TaxID=90675 RepID=A0ABM0WVT3_CAMSA|nr:PREDICTED: protein TIFY 11A-like [Camelina sativa]
MYNMSSRNENVKAQAPEKSDFTRRCSLLSRYLKEKGSFGNIDLGLFQKPSSGLGFTGKSDPPPGKQNALQKAEHFKGKPSNSSGCKVKDADLSESQPESSQLTIFFGGKVIVYNEFPADKAKVIMDVAKQAKPVSETNIQTQVKVENNNKSNIQTQINVENSNNNNKSNIQTQIYVENNNDNKSNMVLPDLNEPTNTADTDHSHPTMEQQKQQEQNQIVERIARRASLHRFFAKRKDRAVARAPYQINQNAGHHRYPPKPETVAGQPLETGQSSQRTNNAVAQTMAHPKSDGDKDVTMGIEEDQNSKDLDLRL